MAVTRDAASGSRDRRDYDDLAEFHRTAQDALERLREHIECAREPDSEGSGYAPLSEILRELQIERWIDEGGMNRESFDAFLTRYLDYSVRLHSPRYIAHQVCIPEFPGALGALVNGVMNNPMAIYEMGPAAAATEFAIVNWMLRKIGWPERPRPTEDGGGPHAAGVLTHGGSLANLTALLAARAQVAPDAWREGVPDDLAVLVPAMSHYSVARSVAILGLGERAVYPLETCEFGVVDTGRLESALARVHEDGRRCMAMVANACSTATGLHDPLRDMGEFCERHGIWFHVDACHGASALLHGETRRFLDGIELADSVVWDAHKMMQVPVICAATLLRDARHFDQAFHQEASYLAYGEAPDSVDSLPWAVECTKASLGLKVFLNLAWRGEAALGDYVADRYAITRRFFEQIRSRPRFECPYEPETNILCFRFEGDDALQDRIRDALVHRRRFHITAATVSGRRYLRLTVMNKLTDETTIEALLDDIERVAAEFT